MPFQPRGNSLRSQFRVTRPNQRFFIWIMLYSIPKILSVKSDSRKFILNAFAALCLNSRRSVQWLANLLYPLAYGWEHQISFG